MQHDYNIANQSGADFRADLNNALSAIATVNSGATEPSTTFAHQLWVDTANNVLKIRNAANDGWFTTGVSITASNTFTGNITGNANTATTLATARTINGVLFDGSANISFDTDSVSEGSSNLYFTNERVDDQVNTLLQAGTGIQLTYDDTAGTLTIANTNDADITGVVAGNGLTGGGTAGTVTLNVAVDNSSIEIDSDALQVKASGITNTMLAGSIANSKLANSSVTINSNALSLGGTLTLDSDNIGEGSSNLYYTDARFDTRLATKDTDDLSEGSSNLYFTNARSRSAISASGDISYNSSTGVISFTQSSAPVTSVNTQTGAVVLDTDNISEGSSNLYFTNARARSAISASGDISYNSSTGVISFTQTTAPVTSVNTQTGVVVLDTDDVSEGSTNIYYTDTRANSAIDARVTKSFVDALNVQAASVDADSVALGTDTTGNYIQTITGTANKITVTGSGSESADVTLTLPDDVQIADSLTVAGNLTVNGTLTSLDTTNLDIEDNLFQLNAGLTGSPVNDSGMLINRGSSDNGIFMWDESVDKFTLGLTTADGTTTGNITLSSLGTLVANLEGNVTGTVTGTVSSLSNHDTDSLSEGSSNLYYTDARVQAVSINNVVEDTTPELGGNLASNGNDILFADSDKAIFGAGSDLQIYHDGTSSYIVNTTNDLVIQDDTRIRLRTPSLLINNGADTENLLTATENGAVTLFYDNASKLATTSTGIDVTGTITSDGLTVDNITIDGTEIDSNTDLTIDAAGDIALDADGGDFRFKDAGTTIATYSNVGGDWYITANSEDNDIVFQGNDGGSTVQALKLDMSDAGTAIFNNKVAIGTSSPTANRRLHIVSTAQNQAKFERSGAATSHIEFDDSTTTNQPSMGGVGDNLTFNTAFTERVRIDSSGNLGINETSPLGKLHVKSADSGASADGGADELVIEGSGDSGLSILSGASNYGNILFSDSGDAAAGRIRYEHDNNALNFGTNGSWDRFYINSAGNVGISNTSLNANLHIGSSNATGNTTNPALQIGGSSTYRLGMYTSTEGAVIENKNGDDGIQFKVKTNGEVMRIVGGAVGINTTAPFSDLSVNVGANAPSSSGNMASEGLTIHNTSGGRAIQLGVNESGAYNYIQSSYVNNANVAVNLAFFTGASERMRIASNGRVGIGTSSPSALFEIEHSSDAEIDLDCTGGRRFRIASTNANALIFSDKTGSAERMRIDSSGKVGIGTSSGTGSIHVTTKDSGGSDVYYVAQNTTSNRLAGYKILDESGSVHGVFRYDNGGNNAALGVGIGSPNYNLHVHKASASSNYMQITNSDTGSGSGDGFLIGVASDEAATIWNQENTRMVFGTNGTERMRIESDGDLKIFGTIGTNSSTAFASMGGRLTFDTDYSDTQRGPNKILLQNDGAWIAGIGVSNGATDFYTGGNFTFRTGTSLGSERMRIDSSGGVLIGKTSGGSTNTGCEFGGGGTGGLAFNITSTNECFTYNNNNSSGATYLIDFRQNNTSKGQIQVSSTSTTYVTSSDARLKDVTGEARGLEVINELNPVSYNWKADGKADEGLIAQEVQEIVPNAVSQNSDDYYQMDYSKLVVHLVKGMKEQQEQIEELKQEIQNLKGE